MRVSAVDTSAGPASLVSDPDGRSAEPLVAEGLLAPLGATVHPPGGREGRPLAPIRPGKVVAGVGTLRNRVRSP